MRRFGLEAERVDVDTENFVSMPREHREMPVLDGNTEKYRRRALGHEIGVPCSACSSLGGCVARHILTAKPDDETEQTDCS